MLALAFACSALQAGPVSLTGQFEWDDRLQLFSFSIGADKVVTLQSWGYGGGLNSAGALIPAGGFDTLFTLFAQSGSQIGVFDYDPGCSHTNKNHGACLDAYYSAFLTKGSYVLALTQSGNFPNRDLIDGFGQQGNGKFPCPHGFCDVFGNQDSGKWAIDILGADQVSQLPEPVTFVLTAAGLNVFGLTRFRRNSGAGK